MSLEIYAKASLRKCSLNNVDIIPSVRSIYFATSILTPFQMVRILVTDGSMIQDSLYESGIPVDIVYSTGSGSSIRELKLMTLANKQGNKYDNSKSSIFELLCVSRSYFNLQNEHTAFYQNISASEVLKKLHKEIDPSSSINIAKTKGLIGDREPFHLRGIKLGKGINMVRNRMTSEKYKSGCFVYYMDQMGDYYSYPLEQLFDQADGPVFSHSIVTKDVLRSQQFLSHNIFSLQKGSSSGEQATDNALSYQKSLVQRGGDPGTGFNWATMNYVKPEVKNTSLPKTPGKTTWAGQLSKKASTVIHKFNYDENQKTQEDFEGSLASQNLLKSLSLQNSILFNVPMEGGIKCLVGKGCYLDLTADVGDSTYKKSVSGKKHLIVAQGEYIFFEKRSLQAIVSIQTASGGKQGNSKI